MSDKCRFVRDITASDQLSGVLRSSLLLIVLLLTCVFGLGQNADPQSTSERNANPQFGTDPATPELRRRTPRQIPTGEKSLTGDFLNMAEGDDLDDEMPDATERAAFSADRIISIIQQQPQLLEPIKHLVSQRIHQTGAGSDGQQQWLDEGAITDDALYSRIQQDPELRLAITKEFRKRGVIPANEQDGDSARRTRGTSRDVFANSRGSNVQRPTRRATMEETEDTPTVRRPNPYPTLPSLKDLYSQYPPENAKLKRFGSDVFRNGTGNSDELPMDVPAGPNYVIGPGDGLTLNLWGSTSQRLTRTVDRQGQIALPEAGSLTVAGLNIAQAQDAIQKTLGTQFQNIHAEISLARLHTVRVYVVGDVQRPGGYDISALSTSLNGLYAAGGPTSRGSLRTVRQFRGRELIREFDLYDFMLRGVSADFGRLQSGDTIVVPPIGPQVTVAGMVRRPAIYEIKGESCLRDVLELAGGVLVSATLHQVNVERIEAYQRKTMLSLRLPSDGNKEGIDTALAAFKVQDGDRVTISPILPYNERTVYLEGHVFRPGKYPYHDGITVNELLRSYQDLLPEPAEHAEIIRLQPPDLRPMTIPFSLSEILSGDDPIDLQPFDVIRIFSRYEIDAPNVSVYGEVLRPGEYPLAQGMTAAGLVQMAGGFKRSALRDEADVSTYVIQDGKKILTKHSVVQVGKAMDGDKSADVVLKPGDVVTIRQLTGWKDIGSAVSVKGEVRYAGTYGIQEGERLSAVLKRAGGFREGAFPAGAVLERVLVREMSEKSRMELIRSIESAGSNMKAGTLSAQEQLATMQAMQQQQQQVLASLKSHPSSGRLVIKISSDISKWENTPADITMFAGDTLVIPKKPTYVLISGQVYNPAAISYVPGKTAGWYLNQAGGATEQANKKSIFVIHADGSVIGQSSSGWWNGSVLSTRLQPGDTIVVPDRVIGGSMFWKNLMSTAQLMSSIGITAAVAASF